MELVASRSHIVWEGGWHIATLIGGSKPCIGINHENDPYPPGELFDRPVKPIPP